MGSGPETIPTFVAGSSGARLCRREADYRKGVAMRIDARGRKEKEGQILNTLVSANAASRPGGRANQPTALPGPSLRRRERERWETYGWGWIRGLRALLDVDSHSPADTVGKRVREKNHKLPPSLEFVDFGPDGMAHSRAIDVRRWPGYEGSGRLLVDAVIAVHTVWGSTRPGIRPVVDVVPDLRPRRLRPRSIGDQRRP
jgi:hypothetical protein